jgi:hypothetical protein
MVDNSNIYELAQYFTFEEPEDKTSPLPGSKVDKATSEPEIKDV